MIDKKALDRWILSTPEEAYPNMEDEWEGFYLYYCQNCPDKDVCVIEPEEYENDCYRYHSSASKVNKE